MIASSRMVASDSGLQSILQTGSRLPASLGFAAAPPRLSLFAIIGSCLLVTDFGKWRIFFAGVVVL